VPDDFNLLDNILYHRNNGNGRNVWTEDFSLHSTYEDALADANAWLCPNNSYNYGYTFYGRCSPDGTRQSSERSIFKWGHDRKDVAYFTNKAEDDGFEEVPTTVIKGRGYARGVALRDPTNGSIYMTGAGQDIHWVRDDFNYMSEPADGDRTVVVHVGSMSNPQPHQWSKTGIMFRAGPETNAANYMVFLTGSRGICSQARYTTGDHTHTTGGCVNSGATEAWLKVEKRADTYTSFRGMEDAAGTVVWTKLDAREVPAIAEADAYHVGLAVSSARYYSMEVVFQHYEVDTYYFPSAAPSMSSFPTVDEPRSVIGADAVASQVSTCYGGAASRAIDGNTAGNWNQGSVMHTCNNANPWWKVDLGRGETQITHVVVTSRTDCCNHRLRNTDLEILDASGTVVASRPFEGDKDVHHFRLGNNVMGRYVKLNKHESGVLNIAEVEVFGTYVAPSAAPSVSLLPTVDEPRTVIGEAAVATQQSTCYGGNAEKAIDGNRDGSWSQRSVMHTCNNGNPWWKVDLGKDGVHITNVSVYSRTDCCWNRLRSTDLEILDAAGAVVATRPFEGVEGNKIHHFTFPNVVGRSVRLNKHESGVLNIAEVEVFGW